jgi:hypothetical protein
MVRDSIRKLGAGRSVLADKHGRMIAGNHALDAAAAENLEAEVVHTTGDKLVVVVRDDLDLDVDPEAVELGYADNRTSEVNYDLDERQMIADMEAGMLDPEILYDEDEVAEILEEAAYDILDDDAGDDGLPPSSPPPTSAEPEDAGDQSDQLRDTWQIVITCDTEEMQTTLLQRLMDEGFTCRALTL